MQLEDYFDFLAPNDIRIKGHRIGIETILYDFVHRGKSAGQIAARYPTLTLEQVYATLTYYLRNKDSLDKYLAAWIEHGDRMREKQASKPTPAMLRLRHIKTESNEARKQAVEPNAI